MGLDLVDHLLADLEILRGRLRQKLLPESEQARYWAIDGECQVLRQQLEDVRQRRAQVTSHLDHARAALAASQRKLQLQGGDRFSQREQLVTDKAWVAAEVASTQRRLCEFAAGCLPLALVEQSLARLRLHTEGMVAAGGGESAQAVRVRLNNLLSWLDGRKYPAKVRGDIRKFIAEQLREVGDLEGAAAAFNWNQLSSQLATVLDHRLPGARQLAIQSLSDDEALAEQLLGLEERLKRMPELEQLAIAFHETGVAEEEIRSLQKEDESLQQQEQGYLRRLADLDQAREALLEQVVKSGDAARSADYCQRSIVTLTAFRSNLIERRRKQLERLILEAFQVLARKSDLVGALSIDPDSMVVRLRTGDGQEIAAQQLSAGERQLLAIAILWGLARASGRPVPVVIDTPLGRLDGEHRKALVERYFPDASHQVILLSTDQEVDADFSRMLDDSVAHRYLIDYDAAQKSSSFSPGYFAG